MRALLPPAVLAILGTLLGLVLTGYRVLKGLPVHMEWWLPIALLAISAYWALTVAHRRKGGASGMSPPANEREATAAMLPLTERQKDLMTFIALRRPTFREVSMQSQRLGMQDSELHFRVESLMLRGLVIKHSDRYGERRLVASPACEAVVRQEHHEQQERRTATDYDNSQLRTRLERGPDQPAPAY